MAVLEFRFRKIVHCCLLHEFAVDFKQMIARLSLTQLNYAISCLRRIMRVYHSKWFRFEQFVTQNFNGEWIGEEPRWHWCTKTEHSHPNVDISAIVNGECGRNDGLFARSNIRFMWNMSGAVLWNIKCYLQKICWHLTTKKKHSIKFLTQFTHSNSMNEIRPDNSARMYL